jgi:putative sterol carrier protein
VFANGRIDVRTGAASEPDVTVITDFETAVALHRGETNAQFAIASGGMKVRGAFDVLLRHATALDSLADAFSALRASTTFPTSPTTASPVATPPGTSR